jgi:Mg/Co/Ni transporter MgtE
MDVCEDVSHEPRWDDGRRSRGTQEMWVGLLIGSVFALISWAAILYYLWFML